MVAEQKKTTRPTAPALSSPLTEAERMRYSAKWGEGRTDEQYKELQRTYDSLAAEYKGAITPRMELNLRDISTWRLERSEAVAGGDIASAKRLTEMIKTTMDSEAMKAGDAKPVEKFRVDSFVDALEKKGLLRDGALLMEGVIHYIQNDKGNFTMSRDAIDAMMLSIVNAMRFNNGMTELPELTEELEIRDRLGEFVKQPSVQERNTMMELGMTAPRRGARS